MQPKTVFGRLRKMKKKFPMQHTGPAESASCDTAMTAALHNTPSCTPAATATNQIGVTGYLDEFANTADLQVRCAP